jgi:uncharacterized protein YraI
MLRKTMTAAALALGASVLVAAPANAVPGFATDRLDVKAGPDYDYPTVAYVRSGTQLEINGCLSDWSWCDVSTSRGRGWVLGEDIVAQRNGRRIVYGMAWGVPTLTFNVRTYWDSNYRNRGFYRDRDNWDRRWNDYGPRRDWWGNHDGRDRDGDGRDRDRRPPPPPR